MKRDLPAIQATNVTVRYGRKEAVSDVSLSVPVGSVHALLGRNGAGKSSLVRCILGQLRPDAGCVELFGEDVWTRRAALMNRIGVVPEEADAPTDARLSELARFASRVYARWDARAFTERLQRFDIAERSRFGELSKGQKKQVMLALALSTSPELVVLDDPTLGLDVVARKSLYEEVIADLADRGITVLITTHDLGPVEALVDHVSVLRAGRIVLDEDVETLKSRFRRIRMQTPSMELSRANFAAAQVRQWGSGTEAVVTNFDELAFERFRAETNGGVAEVTPMSLEEIFIAVSGENGGAA